MEISLVNDFIPRIRVYEKSPLVKRADYSSDILISLTLLPLKLISSREDLQSQGGLNSKDIDVITSTSSSNGFIVIVPSSLPSNFKKLAIIVNIKTLHIVYYLNGVALIQFNERGMFNFEHTRKSKSQQLVETTDSISVTQRLLEEHGDIVDYNEAGAAIYSDGFEASVDEIKEETTSGDASIASQEDGLWEERWGGHLDSKPNGPQSISMDLTLTGNVLYGIPEHATKMSLHSTRGDGARYSEPYRLYNLDVFEYDLDVPMSLYGSIPVMLVQGTQGGTLGVFSANPTELFVDIENPDVVNEKRRSQWISESGILDLFFLQGDKPLDLHFKYATLTGGQELPPLFSLGYHQCRWNYKDEIDVAQVESKFEELDFPYDVLWLDIEHTDGKRYFTWDKSAFPTPIDMQNSLAKHGRKMVTIIDPHIKIDNNYHVHSQAKSGGFYIKKANGNEDFDGWCWPGSSSYLDFTSSKVRDYWASLFAYDKYIGSTPSLYTWNDMNEPSVFNGPEVSMHKDMLSLDGHEHRYWHNLYGFYQQMATALGLVQRNKLQNDRPFVLSRAFFAGSQRYGAIWTGDNRASWDHLEISTPMLLTQGLAGLPFSGADVGGFFGNPDEELLIRWYQSGAYQPFFRAHAHIDSKRREPWLFSKEALQIIKQAVVTRYTYLPFIYTLFDQAATQGSPIMRALWTEFPLDRNVWSLDDQFLLGGDILLKPVVQPNVISSSVYLPRGIWYSLMSNNLYTIYQSTGGEVSVASPLHVIPAFQRGGSIIPRKMRLR